MRNLDVATQKLWCSIDLDLALNYSKLEFAFGKPKSYGLIKLTNPAAGKTSDKGFSSMVTTRPPLTSSELKYRQLTF